jgi:hypothetical protein
MFALTTDFSSRCACGEWPTAEYGAICPTCVDIIANGIEALLIPTPNTNNLPTILPSNINPDDAWALSTTLTDTQIETIWAAWEVTGELAISDAVNMVNVHSDAIYAGFNTQGGIIIG